MQADEPAVATVPVPVAELERARGELAEARYVVDQCQAVLMQAGRFRDTQALCRRAKEAMISLDESITRLAGFLPAAEG